MDASKIHISTDEVRDDDRFGRFRLIGWWDQKKLSDAKVLVIGAGALGNEIIKNLALLGIGNVFIADKDRIENSNLSRSVLYRESDTGKFKAEVAAAAAKDIYPQINVHFFNGDIVHDLGMGVYRWADVVLGGLDNREARLSINRNCYKLNRPWIDGAIEQIQGTARVFVPDGPCYECTMSDRDWKLLQMRRSCNLLSRAEMEGGKTPTTPTIASLIAAVQCQEAVKILHGMESIPGRGWVFSGLSTDAYQTEFQRKPDCLSHDALDDVVALDEGVDSMTVDGIFAKARELVGDAAQIELARDVLEKLICKKCGAQEQLFASLGKVCAEKAICPKCNDRREIVTFNKIRGNEAFMDRPLAAIGVPAMDILIARGPSEGGRSIGIELSGDAKTVLGPLAAEDLEWV